jgi:hypothetical protein
MYTLVTEDNMTKDNDPRLQKALHLLNEIDMEGKKYLRRTRGRRKRFDNDPRTEEAIRLLLEVCVERRQ